LAGVTTQGFVAKTLSDIVTALNGAWRGIFGPAVNVDPTAPDGQIIANTAAPLAEVWKLGEALASAYANPSGVLLDAVAALTNTIRKAATASRVTLTLTGTATTVVAAGKIASVSGGGSTQFSLDANATIAAVAAWTATTTEAVGNRKKNGGNVYQVIGVTGDAKTAGAGGPAGTGTAIVDNHVTWTYLGAGTGAVDAVAHATATGPLQGYASTINTISTPVSGWNNVINLLDAVPGNDLETDAQLRVRRATEASGQGRSPLNALRAQLFKVPGVTSVFIFENTTDLTVGTIPPHSIECLVQGGDDTAVAQAIFDNSAGGPGRSGSTTITITDSEGIGHPISFSRPSDVDIYETITVAVDVKAFPVDGQTQVQDALVASGNALGQGHDVYARAVEAALFTKDADGALLIPGVLDVQVHAVGTAPSPVGSTVPITVRQVPKFDTSRTIVSIVPGNP
jgi:uncharacterized phage protein gp47/JayE